MSTGWDCKHFSIGLPTAAEDQSLTALFQHVANTLAEDAPLSMDKVIAVTFESEVESDAIHRGHFTIVFADADDDDDVPPSRRSTLAVVPPSDS
ncbi:hypothetical protein OG558_25250 [Kribbella sp. NBC_01510]|uniref:hypothetical protein n=1 Tax=unclassified Kribbella TaxID=2644121 RepID=UPI002E35401A|nr:hypothetical protein [Kribbella sp. NBC_01484]